jgi:hypothetical protein
MFRSKLYSPKSGAKLQHLVQIPQCYAPVFGWILGPCVGANDSLVKIEEFGGTLSYQNTGLQAIANKVIEQIYFDFQVLCKIVLEKGNERSNTRETVHIFVNADLPDTIAEAVASHVESKLIECAEYQLRRKERKERNNKSR